MDEFLSTIQLLGDKYDANKVVLFGSRARGDNLERSDIDIAVYGIEKDSQPLFNFDVDEQVKTLLKFDIIHISKNTNSELIKNIERDGVVIYGQSINKI